MKIMHMQKDFVNVFEIVLKYIKQTLLVFLHHHDKHGKQPLKKTQVKLDLLAGRTRY